jgi:hypothetical protein
MQVRMIRAHAAHEAESEEPATKVCDLALGEALLLWSIRMWAKDQASWWRVEAEFRRACPATVARTALTAWSETIMLLAGRAPRALSLNPVEARGVTRDEDAILGLIAASQANDRQHAETQAHELMAAPLVPLLLEQTAILGAALEIGGRGLPPRYALPRAGERIH